MPVQQQDLEWTVERARALPDDGNRYEVLDGELFVTPWREEGVPEYWIVDVDARLVERWRPDDERPEIISGRLEWRPRSDIEPFVLDLPAYFEQVAEWPTG